MEDINRLNIIHVAGTKGKGSTCAFTESFLRAHGRRTGFPRKTGLYTSPHLILPEERIRLNYEPLSTSLFAKYFFEVHDRLPQLASEYDPSTGAVERGPRFLQIFALFAFHVFLREGVDVAIVETHSGGQYDATNVVQKPVVTAISTLGMDHIDMLGPTIENIAWHKAGIFKPGAVALTAIQERGPSEVLKQRSAEQGGEVRFVESDDRLPANSIALEPEVQRKNASLALAAATAFLARKAPAESKDMIAEDITAGVEQFSWPGRFQTLAEDDVTWFLDSAHNNMSVEIAAEWFAQAGRDLQRYAASYGEQYRVR
jgi:folylpolyglutamate synthase